MYRHIIDDGFNAELVTTAYFAGELEIPILNSPQELRIPKKLIPFSQKKKTDHFSEFVHFYEFDCKFRKIFTSTKEELENLRPFQGVISPDCSLYVDMPLILQVYNTYMNRAVAYKLQEEKIYVIPNVRWGDERSYTNFPLNEPFAFLGIPKNSIVSIGTYGCIQSREEKYHLQAGLEAMLDYLSPQIVLIYGAKPKSIFAQYEHRTQFISYPDWISSKRKGVI